MSDFIAGIGAVGFVLFVFVLILGAIDFVLERLDRYSD